ncbi:MAG: hypothetical protein AAF502_19085 [Bacteroidota bacterium]
MSGATGQDTSAEASSTAAWFSENHAYSTLLLIPVFSLASYLSFFKSGKNYMEHIVVNSYITGHQTIFYALFAVGAKFIESEIVEILSVLTAIAYTFWVFWQLFSEGSRILNIVRSLMTYVLFLILSTICLIVLMEISEL